MLNLIKMDLYRLRRGKAIWICLIIAAVLGLAKAPFEHLMEVLLLRMFGEELQATDTARLSDIFSNPFPVMNAMLALLSGCIFFHADIDHGYVKNIVGQMPARGYTVLSKFIVIVLHNLLFMIVGLLANLLGTLIFMHLVCNEMVWTGVGVFFIKLLLIQGICALMLFVTTALRSKALGIVVSVLIGGAFLSVLYLLVDLLIARLFKLASFSLEDYLPDQLLNAQYPDALVSVIASVINIGLFLPLTIFVFDRKDIK